MANKENVEHLIDSIRKNHFSWLSIRNCIGGHCRKLLGKSPMCALDAIIIFLEIDRDTALSLYTANNANGGNAENKDLAIEKLRSLK